MNRTIKQTVVALILVLSLSAYVAAEPHDDAAAYRRGDYATALKLMQPLAMQGSARARFNLGTMHLMGKGVSQDYVEAVKWFRAAAEQGYAPAQFALGGRYTDGLGTQQDLVEAAKWYRRAAEQEFEPAQHSLGVIYANGLGVAQDYVLAYLWASLSAAQGNPSAAENRDMVARRMTPAQMAEAQKLARDWKPTKQEKRVH